MNRIAALQAAAWPIRKNLFSLIIISFRERCGLQGRDPSADSGIDSS